MAKTEVSANQIQMAASAGVELLKNDALPVPMNIAKSGALSILEGLLIALAQGQLVVTNPPPPEAVPTPPPVADDGDDELQGAQAEAG